VGQRAIRQDGAAGAAATRPASTSTDSSPATPSSAPTLEVPKVVGALAIVLVLIFALRAVMRRAFPAGGLGGSSRAVQVLSRTVLSPKQQLMLVRVGRRLIVVADSAGQMSPLSEITDPDEVAALVGQVKDEKLSAAAPAFGGLLGRVRRGMEAAGAAGESESDGGGDRDDEAMPRIADADRLSETHDRGESDGETDADDPARQEINGLLAKVRLISHQFKGT
jgi:flagellar biogenesis protein FliO